MSRHQLKKGGDDWDMKNIAHHTQSNMISDKKNEKKKKEIQNIHNWGYPPTEQNRTDCTVSVRTSIDFSCTLFAMPENTIIIYLLLAYKLQNIFLQLKHCFER